MRQNRHIVYKQILTFFLLALFKGSVCCAQKPDYFFHHITTHDGLLDNKITAILQDHDGFIWVGTQAGLQRFDGTRFKNYFADIRDTTALHSDWISAIFEDSKQRLWIGTNRGSAYILNRATDKFYNYNLYATPGNKINGVWQFAENSKGEVFIAAQVYFKLNNATNQFEQYNGVIGLNKTTITGNLTIDKQDNLWISTTKGIQFYDTRENKLYGSEYNPLQNPLFNITDGTAAIVISGKYVWISTGFYKNLYRYNPLTLELKQYSFDRHAHKKLGPEFQKEYIGTPVALKNGQVIIPLLGSGLVFYHPETDKLSISYADNLKKNAFHVNENEYNNFYITQDKENDIIIGSDLGLNIFNPEKQYFNTHGFDDAGNKLFPDAPVSDFIELPNGDILISYYHVNGGIVKMDKDLKVNKHFLYTEKGNKNSPINQVWNIFRDNKGIIWAPNQKESILKLDLNTGKLIEEKDTVLAGHVNTIRQDKAGNKWVGHWHKGLIKIDAATGKKYSFTNFFQSDSTSIKRVYSILIDSNQIWAGTLANGLQLFDQTNETFTAAYTPNVKDKHAISSNIVTDIIRYNKDTLILATEMGINFFDTKRKIFSALTAKDGLPNNLTQFITLDNHKDLWVICSGGALCKINMQNFTITRYAEQDGIINQVFTSRIYKLKNGKILIGASRNFISFDPSNFTATTAPPGVTLTGLYMFDKEIKPDSFLKNKQPLKLSYKENSLRFEFASLRFGSPGGIKYFYRLTGVDKDWILADKNQAAVYNQLKNGKYVFEIKCSNREGVFCQETTQLAIIINPPYWKTWWFVLTIITGISILVYKFIKWREKNIKYVEAEKLKVEQLNAMQLKNKLELEQIINYFSSSLIDKKTVDEVLWDVAGNLIGRLGFVDCMIYLWNSDHTKMVQRAGYGTKASKEEFEKNHFEVLPGQGLVGFVMQTKEAVVVPDTSKDTRYRVDDVERASEITVPVIYNDEMIGVIDSEHPQKNFFTGQHLQLLSTIATLMADKIKSVESDESLQKARMEMLGINEKLAEAKLEALRSQMNPHFIFNSLNAIQECILTGKVDAAYNYLSQFSRLQRMVLQHSEKEFITLHSELEMLKLYLSLEALRFSQSFTYSIEISPSTDINEIMFPSMLLQPYVENAIWHGLRNKTGEQKLMISLNEDDEELTIRIDDNGIGRKAAGIIKAQKMGKMVQSKGTQLSAQRINILSLKYNAGLSINTIDKIYVDGTALGTTVIIKLSGNIKTKKAH